MTALQAPALFEKVMSNGGESQQHTSAQSVQRTKPVTRARSSTDVSYTGRKVRIKSGRSGHFYANVRMNNRTVKVLVDTGATMVAINETTARKIGIRLKASDFKYEVRTANGIAKMAAATIKEIKIGGISIRNVRAGVSRDSALSTTLLGMSFLKQLKRFEVSGETLLLEQ